MDYSRKAFLQSAAIIIVLLLVLSYVWWHYTGWNQFAFSAGDLPSWKPTGAGKNVSLLRFKDCVFTVQRAGDAAPTSRDVTAVLNSMAVAYSSGRSRFYAPSDYPPSLDLARPLNAFSFVIPGFNDVYYLDAEGNPRGTVKDPSAAPWCGPGGPAPLACSAVQDCAGVRLNSACREALGGAYGRPCASDADCGADLPGSCNAGVCGPVNSCTGVAAIANAQAGRPCKSDLDCDSVAGSCQKGVCTDSPPVPGVCRNCSSDADCGGVVGSCAGYVAGPPGQPCATTLGICSLCPGGATVTLTGLVRAI